MTRKIGKVDLEVHKGANKVFAFQEGVGALRIAAMWLALDYGCKFPRVDLVESGQGEYQLLYGAREGLRDSPLGQYGGTHRSYSVLTKPGDPVLLRANLWSRHVLPLEGSGISFIPLDKVRRSYYSGHESGAFTCLSFLPFEIGKDFCEQHGLEVWRLRQGIRDREATLEG